MSTDYLIAQAVLWSVVIAASLLVMRRSDRWFRDRLAEYDRNEVQWRAELRRTLDEMDRREAERAEASRRRLDRMLAASAALAADPNAGDDSSDGVANGPPGVVVWVSFPADMGRDDASAVVQKVRAAVEDARTATGGRIPIEIHAPAT